MFAVVVVHVPRKKDAMEVMVGKVVRCLKKKKNSVR